MTTGRTATVTLGLVLALSLGLGACSGAADDPPAESASSRAQESGADTPDDDAQAASASGDANDDSTVTEPDAGPETEPSAEPDPNALPAGFPDPATLIGQPAYDERSADGSWHTVIGGTPLELVNGFGACFDGGTGDLCAYSISSAVPAAPDGSPGPAEAALLLLLSTTGHAADGTPTWEVVDAIVTRPPDGAPALLDLCEGTPGVAIYADPSAAPADTIPAAAAWGTDAGVTSLVEVDPAGLSCAPVGH